MRSRISSEILNWVSWKKNMLTWHMATTYFFSKGILIPQVSCVQPEVVVSGRQVSFHTRNRAKNCLDTVFKEAFCEDLSDIEDDVLELQPHTPLPPMTALVTSAWAGCHVLIWHVTYLSPSFLKKAFATLALCAGGKT